MTHGSLFSGMGGFDLAAEWMGWENVFHCEYNPFGQRILKYYWPKAISYHDIKQTDFTKHRGTIDILTGGFPCQPYSQAGKRKGKEDERHLWPEMLRAVREIQPRWVVGENVRGLINWNGGMVFDEVQADLEAEGYEVFPFLLPACAVDAPHRRDRIWFIAYSDSYGNSDHSRSQGNNLAGQQPKNTFKARNQRASETTGFSSERFTTNTPSEGRKERKQVRGWENAEENSTGFGNGDKRLSDYGTITDAENERGGSQREQETDIHRRETGKHEQERIEVRIGVDTIGKSWPVTNTDGIRSGENDGEGKSGFSHQFGERIDWIDWPTQSPVCTGDDGLSFGLDAITIPSKRGKPRILRGKQAFGYWRKESIKAGGNAIVPQVVYQIFKAIEQYNQMTA